MDKAAYGMANDRKIDGNVKITTLIDENKAPGSYSVIWDGADHTGAPVASGVYLYRIHTGNDFAIRKMLLLK